MSDANTWLIAQAVAVEAAAETGPAVDSTVIVANLLVLLMFVGCIVAWVRITKTRLLRGRPMVDPVLRSPAFWSPMPFVLLIGLVLVISPLAAATAKQLGIAMEGTNELVLGTGVFLVCCGLTIGYIAMTFPARFGELGLRPHWPDVRLGVVSGLFVIPPLMILMGLLSKLRPYEHDVLDAMADESTPVNFAALFITTAIVTPFVEEFAIRVLLQGSLQAVADQKDVRSATPEQRAAPLEGHQDTTPVAAEPAPSSTADSENPYETPSETSTDIGGVHEQQVWTAPQAIWPMVVTSGVFAGLHVGQGLAPVALFFFSLALGYLYRQTGRITAPVVLHMVLNSMTMIATYFGVG